VVIGVHQEREAELAEIAQAFHAVRLFAGATQRREEQRDQD